MKIGSCNLNSPFDRVPSRILFTKVFLSAKMEKLKGLKYE